MTLKNILVFGGGGLLGTMLQRLVFADHNFFFVERSSNIDISPNKKVIVNDLVADENLLGAFVEKNRIDTILNLVAATNVDECEKDASMAMRINVDFSARLAGLCKKWDLKLIQISTDHLYGDKVHRMTEADPVDLINVYAKTKFSGENAVLEICKSALVIRTNFFGMGSKNRKSFSDWIYSELSSGKKLMAFGDVFFTPVHGTKLLELILSLGRLNESGVFNVSSDQMLSKYDFALSLARSCRLDESLIIRSTLSHAKLLAPRPRNMALSNEKLKNSLGMRTIDLGDHIELAAKNILLSKGKK